MKVAVTIFFMFVLVLCALWTRFSGLGYRQLAQDEYYFIKSVQNIMEFGVPRYESGGYYTRGILLQYLTALSIYVFGDGGFAYRLPSALFGVGTVIVAYFLGRQFLSRSWSLVLVAMLTFSSWEIEFSRFARMYSGLQFVAVCFYWSLYRYSFNDNSNKRYLAVAFAMIAILTHALGIFLAALLFVPLPALFNQNLRTTIWEQRIYLTLSSMVLCIGYLQTTGGFKFTKITDSLPSDFIMPHANSFHWLSFGIGWFGKSGMAIIAVMAVCLAGGYVLYSIRNRIGIDVEKKFLGVLLVLALCFAMVHQFAMCTLIMGVVVLREPRLVFKKPYLYFFVLFSTIISFWLVLLWFSHTWHDNVGILNNIRAFRRSIRLNFFMLPDFYLPVLRTWVDKVPVLAAFLGVAVGYEIICIRKLSWTRIATHPVVPIVLLVIAMGVRKSLYLETRYSYYIYPFLLCVALLSGVRLGEILERRLIKRETLSKSFAIALCLIAFGLSEEFNSFHLLNLDSDIIAYRMGNYDRFSSHWYQRWDFKGVAEFLDANTSETSMIILSREVDTMAFYLKKEFIFYWDRDSDDYTIVSRDRGTREVRSGNPMISTTQEVINLSQSAKSVWLVFYPEWRTWQLNPETVWPGRVKSVEVYKPGRDKRIEVWKIEFKGFQ
jgi:hypothetical protein